MLLRSLRLPPSLLLLIVFLAFFGWHLSQGTHHEDGPVDSQLVDRDGKRAPRVALITFVTDQRSYLHLSLKNHDHYARRHGYDFIVDYESHTDRTICFWKFDMTERLIKSGKYDWIWWLDFDSLITNTDIKITDIIEEELRNVTNPDEIDFMLSHDCNGINAGSFIARGHERSLKFFSDAREIDDKATAEGRSMSDQDAIVKLVTDDAASAALVHVVPQWKLNAFPEEISCYDTNRRSWERGLFVVHFAGAWAHVQGKDPTGQLMKKYESDIIWGNAEEFY